MASATLPSPVFSLVTQSVSLIATTLMAVLFGAAVVSLVTRRRSDDGELLSAVIAIGLSAAACYWSIALLRGLIRSARFRNDPVVVELSPDQLRVENPVAWGDVSLVWKREEIYSLKLQHDFFPTGLGGRGYALDVRKTGRGERTTTRLRSTDADAIEKLRDAIDRFVPRR